MEVNSGGYLPSREVMIEHRLLKQQSLRVSYKPQRTINSFFPPQKQQDETDRPSSEVVYRIKIPSNPIILLLIKNIYYSRAGPRIAMLV